MVSDAAHFAGDSRAAAAVLAQLQDAPLRLEHPLIETELLRRRRATIVVDAEVNPRVDRQMAALMGWRSYAAAPLVVGAHVVGVIHADRGAGQALDVLDRDVLWEFATGLAQAYESTVLRRTLRDERNQMSEFLEWMRARSSELTDASVRLSDGSDAPVRPPAPPPAAAPSGAGAGARDDRVVFEGLLTRRELDVLRLLAEGASNRAHRRRARDLERHREVSCQQHPAQAARGQPGRGGDSLPPPDGHASALARAQIGMPDAWELTFSWASQFLASERARARRPACLVFAGDSGEGKTACSPSSRAGPDRGARILAGEHRARRGRAALRADRRHAAPARARSRPSARRLRCSRSRTFTATGRASVLPGRNLSNERMLVVATYRADELHAGIRFGRCWPSSSA